MRWLSIRDQAESVVEDVHRIRSHPLVNPAILIYGYIFDVKTGRLNEVTAATEVGRPRS
jgi:carbonic anhydrase